MASTNNDSKNDNTGGKSTQSGSSGSGNQGFASMDPERQKEIASKGGQAAHAAGTAHEFTSEEAREVGSHSHDNDSSKSGSSSSGSSRSGSSNSSSSQSSGGSSGGSSRGGSSEQHAEAGRQSHKNDNR